MQKNQETMEGLLYCLDDAISSRNRRYETLDAQYKNENGHILQSQYDEYSSRKKSITNRFKEEAIDYQEKIDRLCQRIRKSQPSLLELSASNINVKNRFPRNIALGKLHVRYNNLDFYVPKTFSFPFDRPMYICDDTKVVLLHKVLLRLLFTLPINKQEYYVFDPIGLGKTIGKFNSLFSNEQLFPQKKILSSTIELKAALKDVTNYILDLQSNVFNIESDCQDWDSYNRRLYSQREIRKILTYKVFIFTAVPDGMDQECFDMFRTLIAHGKQCGLMILFSFNEAIFNLEDSRMKKMEVDLKGCIEQSIQLHHVFEEDDINKNYSNLTTENIGEKFPDDHSLSILLNEIKSVADQQSGQGISFDELMEQGNLFQGNSKDGLSIPIGCGASGNSKLELFVGDSTPHYLIGGTTGSGKSNLLHNLIISACCKYSPNELRVYLLDFKEGVEFSQYVNPKLKHAMLVATEADTEYGITVLKHLLDEKERRYAAFKNSGCKDIQGYRNKNSTALMPRILAVIDEFQVLFGNTQKDQTIATLEMIAKQGRACGIHLVLATQSLKGIDFSTLGPQFGGRIALKCSAEDSKILLGGITSNNEEASGLKVPYAILNTTQGNVSGNVKFMVPKAEESKISESICLIEQRCDELGIETETRIFEGQSLPGRPKTVVRSSTRNMQICFGELMDYTAEPFLLNLRPRVTDNLLLCGHDDNMKKSMLDSIIQSAIHSEFCEEIIYVGDDSEMIDVSVRNEVICVWSMKDFCEKYTENMYDKKRVLIIDNCNLTKQIGYAPTMYGTPKPEAAFFKDYIDNANENGSFIMAFYEGSNRIKNCGVPKDEFNYRIGYSVNVDEKNFLLGAGSQSNAPVNKNRAFLVDNLELKAWFRPYLA
ncbi:MAG: FtsK/SpoIIIE domain-containing protein [bacterium]|nr:FtsK/SpoIIIE domain-containing protein [bacterium]